MAALRGLRQILCVLALMALTACSGVGKGDKVDYVVMVSKVGDQTVILPSNFKVQAYQCIRQQLGILAVFEGNSSADFSNRAGTTWSSSNPAVVRVSDGTERDPVNPDRVFPKGVLIPVREGSAVITADYVGVTTSIHVDVSEPDSIYLSTSAYDLSSNASATPLQSFNMAPGSTQQYYAYARLRDDDNVPFVRDVTGQADWTVRNDPRSEYLSVTTPPVGSAVGGGLVTALSAGGPLTVQAKFTACIGARYEDVVANVEVSGLDQLTVQHDPAFNPANPLVVGTREPFQAIATLNNGATQDLSLQSEFTTNGGVGILGFAGNVATALKKGETKVTARFKSSRPSPDFIVKAQEATLKTYELATSDENKRIEKQGFYRYRINGIFKPTVTGPDFTQDLTLDSAWSSSDPTVVKMSNATDTAGIALSQQAKQGCVLIATAYTPNPTAFNDLTRLGVGVGVSSSVCP